ncbi:hypothetical protein [Pedobacter jejuensis]|uniref:DUF4138 domain-containing protein n=1 Tax=Pedobacter jejuensis TaxID=1268550 RepID=A0A3N0BZZ1_9SPHI|nr:hypothetical protein [Pedobacter jejuensis]RNL54966.1 hypothetical protein D7004_06040 [Pedobacter jejuensis]
MKYHKSSLIIILLILLNNAAKAQVTYFGEEVSANGKLEIFKNTTTLFTLQYSNYAEKEKFDEVIKKTWTITPYKIIKPEDLAKYDTLKNYSFFYFDAFVDNVDTITNTNVIYGLKLITPGITAKEKKEDILAYVTLFSDVYTNLIVKEQGTKSNNRKGLKAKLLNNLYNNSRFLNFSPGFLAGYLKQINDGLTLKQSRSIDYQFYNKVRLPDLAKETLYVPEYVREIFSSQPPKIETPTTIQEPYSYKLKFISNSELDSLVLNDNVAIKYLIYTQRSFDKIISIYDSKDDRIIYQRFYFQNPVFEMSDLNNIKEVVQSLK